MEERKCTTHHHACDCREEKIKRLVKAIRSFRYSQTVKTCRVLDEALEEWKGEFGK